MKNLITIALLSATLSAFGQVKTKQVQWIPGDNHVILDTVSYLVKKHKPVHYKIKNADTINIDGDKITIITKGKHRHIVLKKDDTYTIDNCGVVNLYQ